MIYSSTNTDLIREEPAVSCHVVYRNAWYDLTVKGHGRRSLAECYLDIADFDLFNTIASL